MRLTNETAFQVKLAKHLPTGKEVAIKIIDKTQLTQGSLQKVSIAFLFVHLRLYE